MRVCADFIVGGGCAGRVCAEPRGRAHSDRQEAVCAERIGAATIEWRVVRIEGGVEGRGWDRDQRGAFRGNFTGNKNDMKSLIWPKVCYVMRDCLVF